LSLLLALVPTSGAAQSSPETTGVPGLYDADNPVWQDTLTVSDDGKFRRGKGHAGKWTFDGAALTLVWNSGRPTVLKLMAPGKFADKSFTLAKRPPPDWLEGQYDAVHDQWRDRMTISADGVFARSSGEGGTWSFDGTLLVLHWTKGGTDTASVRSPGKLGAKGFTLAKRPVTIPPPVEDRPISQPSAPETVPSEVVRQDIPGIYDGSHPHWGDSVIISNDGRYRRGNGDPGKWTFDGTTLALTWDNWGSEPVSVVSAGKFSNGSFTLTKRPPPAWFLGDYDAVHPHWSDVLTLLADGKVKRAGADAGQWSFDGATLVFHWPGWGDEPVSFQSEGKFSNTGGFSVTKRGGAVVAQEEVELEDCAPAVPPGQESSGSAITAGTTNLRQAGMTLNICYLDTLKVSISKVEQIARTWTQYANIKMSFNGRCQAGAPAEIVIGGADTKGSWYWLPHWGPCSSGQGCAPNMNLAVDSRRTVLHEFGHALGLVHEHMNPKTPIPWNVAKLEADGKKVEQYTKNPGPVYSSALDPYSIMMYRIPYKYILGGKEAWLRSYPGFPLDLENTHLSDADKTYIARLYPPTGAPDTKFSTESPKTITFYKDTYYRGEARTFSTDVRNLRDLGFNDVSSVKLSGIQSIAVFEHRDHSGACITIRGDTDVLPGGWNDLISSFVLNAACNEGSVVVFDDKGYRGASATYDNDQPSLGGMDNKVSSTFVKAGNQMAAFSEPNYRGLCQTFGGNVENMKDHSIGNDTISSIWVSRPCPGPQAELFKDKNYTGQRVAIINDVANLRDVGFNDEATSVRLIGSVPIAGYEHVNFGGRCITLGGPIGNLKDHGMNDKISSVRARWTCEGGAQP
jgi:hypothetical protein